MKKLVYIFYCLLPLLLQLPTDITAQPAKGGSASCGQTYERKLSASEWIEEMVNCKDSVYILENAEI